MIQPPPRPGAVSHIFMTSALLFYDSYISAQCTIMNTRLGIVRRKELELKIPISYRLRIENLLCCFKASAHNTASGGSTLADLQNWVREGAFMAQNIVSSDLIEIFPCQNNRFVAFLLGKSPHLKHAELQ